MAQNEDYKTEEIITQAIVNAWNNLDAEVIEPYLADDLNIKDNKISEMYMMPPDLCN